jgi:hypothetical protein
MRPAPGDGSRLPTAKAVDSPHRHAGFTEVTLYDAGQVRTHATGTFSMSNGWSQSQNSE